MTVYISGDTRDKQKHSICSLGCIHFKAGKCERGRKTMIPIGHGWSGKKIREKCGIYEVKKPT